MPRYRTAGGLDDAVVDDGDIGFIGVNLRLPPWQLGAGILALSMNGRIDGDWRPRPGVDVVSEGSIITGSPLRLPFWLVDELGGAVVTAASRVGELVTLTVPAHGLPVGGDSAATVIVNPSGANNSVRYTAVVSGMGGSGISVTYTASAYVGGPLLATVEDKVITIFYSTTGALNVAGTLSDGLGNPIVFPTLLGQGPDIWRDPSNTQIQCEKPFQDNWWLRYDDGIIFASWYSNDEVQRPDQITTWIPNGISVGSPVVSLAPNTAQQVINLVNTIDGFSSAGELVVASPSGTVTGPVAAIGPIYLQGGSGGASYLGLEDVGGTPAVDPNGVWFMTPTDANTLEFEIANAMGGESYDVTGATVLSRIDDFSTGQVLGSCLYSDPSSNNDESIFLAYGNEVKRVALSDGSVTSIGLPGTETLDGEINMVQAMDKVLLFRAGKTGMEWVRGATDFTLVPSGPYTQPQILTANGSGISSSDGLVEFTVSGNVSINKGDYITIYGATDVRFSSLVGKQYQVESISGATIIRCYIPVPDSASGSNSVQIGRQVSVGGGFIFAPAFPWAIYFQRRIWGPYWYNYGTPFVDRNIRDELVASDILDTDTYDPLQNQFRITDGTADYIVALHPFYSDTLVVLNRNSLHAVVGTVGTLQDTSVRELTREIGCLARKSVVTQGNSIFFLSDNGVYWLEFLNDYNLRGTEKPLSEAIQPYIDRISQDLAPMAVGTYFNNRYWLAVPLDSAPKQGDAIGNNSILVFNLLNSQWESVDTFGDPNFLINNFIIGRSGQRNDLYAITSTGGIHAVDKTDMDFDRIATNAFTGTEEFPIDSKMTTRAYLNGTGERKRFADFGVQMKSGSSQVDIGMTFFTEDPDSDGNEVLASSTLLGIPLPPSETADLRARIGGLRGFNGSLNLRRVIGRPMIRGIKVSATTTNRETLSQS